MFAFPSVKNVGNSMEEIAKDVTTDTAGGVADVEDDVAEMMPKPEGDSTDAKQNESTIVEGTRLVLDIIALDKRSKKTTNLRCSSIGLAGCLDGADLARLRKLLTIDGSLESQHTTAPFCTKQGANVSDDVLFYVYVGMNGGMKSPDVETPAKNISIQRYEVYIKTAVNRISLSPDEARTAFLQKYVDGSENDMSSRDPFISLVASQVWNETIFPADMTESHWNVVIRTNNLLYGYKAVTEESDSKAGSKFAPKGVERALYSAFDLKPRTFRYTDIPSGLGIETSDQLLQIPPFRVADDSYVDVFETSGSFNQSMARSAFAETIVEASMSGGACGFSVGASVGHSTSSTDSKSESNSTDTRDMNISYNVSVYEASPSHVTMADRKQFPRVVLELDADSLQLSRELEEDLKQVDDEKTVEEFYKKYGYFFVRRVELGGRLHSSEASKVVSGSNFAERANQMKASAKLSFSTPWVGGSVSASHETRDSTTDSTQKSDSHNSMTWEAQGGDTLLCNDPPAWCSTVSNFYNWRVIKQEKLIPLIDLIGQIPGFDKEPERFKMIMLGKRIILSNLGCDFRLNVCNTEKYLSSTLKTNLLHKITHDADAAAKQHKRCYRDWPSQSPRIEVKEMSGIGCYSSRLVEGDVESSTLRVQMMAAADPEKSQRLSYNQRYKISFPKKSDFVLSSTWSTLSTIGTAYLCVWGSPEYAGYFGFVPESGDKEGDIEDGSIVRIHVFSPRSKYLFQGVLGRRVSDNVLLTKTPDGYNSLQSLGGDIEVLKFQMKYLN
ncbi:MAG: hypothetical protein M1834_005715 [Cirrosporium novae-zelandiae]|nr:MAG: hypothetical protein M1834_005715 [Cirrosporium novae-zelandiae]